MKEPEGAWTVPHQTCRRRPLWKNEGHFLVAAADVRRSAAAADRPALSENSSAGDFDCFNIVLGPSAQQLKKSSLNLQSTQKTNQKAEVLRHCPQDPTEAPLAAIPAAIPAASLLGRDDTSWGLLDLERFCDSSRRILSGFALVRPVPR